MNSYMNVSTHMLTSSFFNIKEVCVKLWLKAGKQGNRSNKEIIIQK